MIDKKLLIETNIAEVYNNFINLCDTNILEENTLMTGLMGEEGEEDPNQQGADPNAMGGDPNAMPQGADPMAGGDPNAADPNAMGGDPNAMGGDPNAMPQGGAPNPGDPMAGGDPMGGMPPMDDPMAGGAPMGDEEEMVETEEDEVIDVDDITNAQEKTSARVNKVGRNLEKVDGKIQNILTMIQSLQSMIDGNNAKIAEFQKEFEKRNPTPVEQMNLRSLDSFPFNENPKNYWEKKGTQPYVSGNRYEAYANNDEPVAKKEYVITNKDVEDFNNNKIEDSFHINDDLRSTIEKIFDL